MCDYRSCHSKDIVDVAQVYPDCVGEGFNVYFNEGHRWHFVSNQTPQEIWMLKQMDSKLDAADCKLNNLTAQWVIN